MSEPTTKKQSFYLKYKKVCKDLVSCNPENLDKMDFRELSDYKKRVARLHQNFLECAKLRETFKYTYVPQDERNAGHDIEISRNRAAAAECGAELDNINNRFVAIATEIERLQRQTQDLNIGRRMSAQTQSIPGIPVIPETVAESTEAPETKSSVSRRKTTASKKRASVLKNKTPGKSSTTKNNDASLLIVPPQIPLIAEEQARKVLYDRLHPVESDFDVPHEVPVLYDVVMKDLIHEVTGKNPNEPLHDKDWDAVKDVLVDYDTKALYMRASKIYGYYIIDNIRNLPSGTPHTYTKFTLVFDDFKLTVVVPSYSTMAQVNVRIHKDFSKSVKIADQYDTTRPVKDVLPYGSIVRMVLNTDIIPKISKADFPRIKKMQGWTDDLTYENMKPHIEDMLRISLKGAFKVLLDRVRRTEITLRLKLLKKVNAG